MRGLDRIKSALYRWDRLLSAVVLGLPFLLMMVFGFVWLIQNGWFLWFLLITMGISAAVIVARWWSRKFHAQEPREQTSLRDSGMAVEADPDWLPHEKQAFDVICRHIEELTREVKPWESLTDHAFDIVDRMARLLGGDEKTALHFTIPEALLLVERTTTRYRQHLLTEVPFSDQISIATLHWLWQRRRKLALLVKVADSGRRLLRMAINPARGVMQEIELLVAGGNSRYLTEEMMATLQAVLLEEVAFSAVELYSGRLKFSDAELLQIQLGTTSSDRKRLAQPDEPLRILLIGQISAGKSTLLNSLLEVNRAETDTAPTTADLVTYEVDIDGIPCHILDSRGLDGSENNRRELCDEMISSDMILWLLRADRPARSPDLALKQAFDEWFLAHPRRRKPVVIPVATCMDRLSEDWPFAENHLPEAVQHRFSLAVERIGRDMEGLIPRPVSSLPPGWNLDAIFSAIEVHLGEALMVQRNRRRAEAEGGDGFMKQARRGGRGAIRTARLLGGRTLRRNYAAWQKRGRKASSPDT